MPEQTDPPTALLARFDEAMLDVYRRAKSEAKYTATRFLEMVTSEGGLTTAHKLLAADHVSDGFTALWEAGRQDLTVEAVVLQAQFQELFAGDELRTARERLGLKAPVEREPTIRPGPDIASLRGVTSLEVEPGDSQEQRDAEAILLSQLSGRLNVRLSGHRFEGEGGVYAQVDGYCESPPIIVEAWAHLGVARGGQRHKVLADALKLAWIDREYLGGQAQKIILVADEAAIRHLRGRSWMRLALDEFGIAIHVEELPADVRESVSAAQLRQTR